MKRYKKHIACLATAMAMTFASCDSGYDCSLENIAYNHIGFYITNEYGGDVSYTHPDAITVSLMVNGRDSIVVNHIQGTKQLTLPMSYTQECDTVILSYSNDVTDTLYVRHSNIPFYQSMECGVIMHHKLLGTSHTDNFIDSVAITNADINFGNNENIKIYFIE